MKTGVTKTGIMFDFRKKEDLLVGEKSLITNCHFKIKDDENQTVFTNYGEESFIIKLDGYAIIPLIEYKKLTKPSFLSIVYKTVISILKYILGIVFFLGLMVIVQLNVPHRQISLSYNESILFVVIGIVFLAILLKLYSIREQ